MADLQLDIISGNKSSMYYITSVNENYSENLVKFYPNPINNTGTIEFLLDIPATFSYDIYDLLGKKVSMIRNQKLISGTHSFNIDGNQLENGTYFIKYKINDVENAIQFIVSH